MLKLLKYALYDILKSRFALIYTVFLALVAISIYQVSDDLSKVSLSLMNIMIMIVPLISAVFATTHFYNNLEFIELMLAQPVKRSQVFLSQLFAVIIMLSLSILIGFGLPMMLWGADSSLITLLAVGIILSAVFTGFAFLASVMTRDKAKAIGISLGLWIYFSLVYDGFVLYFIYSFADYPLEKATLALVMLNPVDLGRILMLMQLDISALMGYTGAFFQKFFSSSMGLLIAGGTLMVWMLFPNFFALRVFRKRDF
ncbi:Cu-processing system permease protein [Algoriphagus alkaliphilus]|uniref:Cu-processing system permease protein n=1 Tax=Algoriphagus alkaliphilus TaxID=279824 RepID=A0A1G5VPA7_9BACT|nr:MULTISPECIES: ABC transporter permease subunit [Algoriphagus]MBA4301461.1 ABC transporter permease [Cyclobacterium sp.]MDO8966070.1 ABC transporter permease subunit [Algoriphagus sp.]MDP2043484.1 ABC transporter permease subunit [Algoriphagus sp.]MDP3199253.1 ABC transporter permease subunit [Algoriphagus sp.]MDP3472460.1 ABC transporter permease subunit [Algoriphagus sp.]